MAEGRVTRQRDPRDRPRAEIPEVELWALPPGPIPAYWSQEELEAVRVMWAAELDPVWTNALRSAVISLLSAPERWTVVNGREVRFQPGGYKAPYTVTASSCTCDAGARNAHCYHQAGFRVLAEAARRRARAAFLERWELERQKAHEWLVQWGARNRSTPPEVS